jgi:pyruvate/2-oxoglutarate/acetoin dehydrogenase E1 component
LPTAKKRDVRELGTDIHSKRQACKKFTDGTYTQEIGPACGFFTLAVLSLVPFYWDLPNALVMKTTRAIIVEEGPRQGGWGAEIAATLFDTLSDYLTAPVKQVASPSTPVPFSPPMQNFCGPDTEHMVSAVRRLIGSA